jgi:hypothetical protein
VARHALAAREIMWRRPFTHRRRGRGTGCSFTLWSAADYSINGELAIIRAMSRYSRHGAPSARCRARRRRRRWSSPRPALPWHRAPIRRCPTDRGPSARDDRPSDRYADIGIKVIMPSAGLCRMAGSTAGRRLTGDAAVRHNQSASRKASNLSSGRYRPGLVSSVATRDKAFSFILRSAGI